MIHSNLQLKYLNSSVDLLCDSVELQNARNISLNSYLFYKITLELWCLNWSIMCRIKVLLTFSFVCLLPIIVTRYWLVQLLFRFEAVSSCLIKKRYSKSFLALTLFSSSDEKKFDGVSLQMFFKERERGFFFPSLPPLFRYVSSAISFCLFV